MIDKERLTELLKDLESKFINGTGDNDPTGLSAYSCTIDLIEHALGFKLYKEQIDYIFHDGPYNYSSLRTTGKTTAHCIKLALSDGQPLNGNKPDRWCDIDHGKQGLIPYSRWYFSYFMKIREQLRSVRLGVRSVKYKGKID